MNISPDVWMQLIQAAVFVVSGTVSGVISDVFFVIRRAKRGTLREVCCDFLFMLCFSAVLFLTVVSVVQDKLRGFDLFSMLAGFLIWRLTCGRVIRKGVAAIFERLERRSQSRRARAAQRKEERANRHQPGQKKLFRKKKEKP